MIPTLQANRTPFRAAGRHAGSGPDFTPVRESPGAATAGAEALEAPFHPAPEELVSFLVNGLCLIGGQRVLEWEAGPASAPSPAAALEALGHAVTRGGPGRPAPRAGGFDRAFRAGRALGYGGEESVRIWLKAMHRALQPGGLLLFHVFDRDRAFGLAERLSAPAAGDGAPAAPGSGSGAYAFDPGTGMLTARLRPRDVDGAARPPGCLRAAVRTFHIGELRSLLAESGFALERAYGDWRGGTPEEAGARTGRILVVAAKERRGRAGHARRRAGRAAFRSPGPGNAGRKEGGGA